jgi:hypothetical protein
MISDTDRRISDPRLPNPWSQRSLLSAQCPNTIAGATDTTNQSTAKSITSRGSLQRNQTETKAATGGPMVPIIPDGRKTRLIDVISPHDPGGFPQTRLNALGCTLHAKIEFHSSTMC